MPDRSAAFAELVARAAACRVCPAMAGRRRVLGAANGPLDARVVFVAEAPGRLGGERTGVPLTGDQTGRNFLALLAAVGWRREDVFVTNAVLCNPRRGERNRTPTATEIAACRDHLAATIAILDPPVVVALGRVALRALAAIAPHAATLADAGRPFAWHGRTLVPLYHPGPRAQIHRPIAAQRADFARLAAFVGAPRGIIGSDVHTASS